MRKYLRTTPTVSLMIWTMLWASLIFSCAKKKIEYLPDSARIIEYEGKYCFDKGYFDNVMETLEKCRAVLKTEKDEK